MREFIRDNLGLSIIVIYAVLFLIFYWREIACRLFGHKVTITHWTEVKTADERLVNYASQWGCFRCHKGGVVTYSDRSLK